MCLACDMEGLWFAVMEARAAAGEATGVDQPDEPATLLAPGQQQEEPATLLPPPERGRVGEGVTGGAHETSGVVRGESEDPHPNPPPEGGGGSKGASRRFACEETSAE
jgi:hypothetical protein